MSAAILTTALTALIFFVVTEVTCFQMCPVTKKRQIMISSNHIFMDINGLFRT